MTEHWDGCEREHPECAIARDVEAERYDFESLAAERWPRRRRRTRPQPDRERVDNGGERRSG